MSENGQSDTQTSHKNRIAGGAGYAFLGRMGAIIEGLSVIAFSWFYGAFIFGLYAVFWGYVKIITGVSEVAMTTSLQRFVPRADGDNEKASAVAGFGLKISFLIAVLLSGIIAFIAPGITHIFNAAPEQQEELTKLVRLYVWILPLWTLVEVATASVRATRNFGPEIKVRIFYEQGFRLTLAIAFALLGYLTYGLFIAHMISVFLTALFALRLISKYYNFRAVLKAPMSGPMVREMLAYGVSVMPSNLTKKLFSEFPVIFLNILLPGADGAAASAFYAVARKIASALQAIRLTFEYVMAPLAAERDGAGDHDALNEMYGFATRLSFAVALPFGAAIIWASKDILGFMRPEFAASYCAILILVTGRALEALSGPSSAIIEMLGHRMLPTINSLVGVILMLSLGYFLIPEYGVVGAAIGAALGLNVTAYLNLFESMILFKLVPYSRDNIRPYMVAALCAGILLLPSIYEVPVPKYGGLVLAIIGLIVSLLILVRFGLNADDAEALGKFGRINGKGRRKKPDTPELD